MQSHTAGKNYEPNVTLKNRNEGYGTLRKLKVPYEKLRNTKEP